MNKLQVSFLLLVSSLFIIGSSQEALAFVIDFDDLPLGDVFNREDVSQPYKDQIPNGPPGLGVRIYADNFNEGATQTSDADSVPNQFLPNYLDLTELLPIDLAVVFDSDNPTGGDGDLEASFTYTGALPNPGTGTDPQKILIIQENPTSNPSGGCAPTPIVFDPPPTCVPDDEAARPNGQFIFVFTAPVAILSIDVFDVETEENDPNDILFYDENGQFLGQFSDDDVQTTGGNNLWTQVPLNAIRVKTMIIEWPGSGAIDNIVYDIPVGGKIIPTTNVSLFVGEAQPDSFLILGAFTLVGAVTFGALYFTTRRNFVKSSILD